jgi:hypothetical protein
LPGLGLHLLVPNLDIHPNVVQAPTGIHTQLVRVGRTKRYMSERAATEGTGSDQGAQAGRSRDGYQRSAFLPGAG